jgi:hypothetical protein
MKKLILIVCSIIIISNLSGQNIGIGTLTPTANLEVKNPGLSSIKISSASNMDTTKLIFANRDEFIGTDMSLTFLHEQGMFFSSKSLFPYLDSDSILFMTPRGDVGVNTRYPVERLDVNGRIRSNGLLIKENYIIELGAGLDKQEDNGKIGLNVFGENNTLSIVGGGTALNGSDRKIKMWANGGTIFTGGANFSSSLIVSNSTTNPTLDISGGKGNISSTEGDFRIGTAANRLKMGVFTTGGTAGQSRIFSSGTSARLTFGLNSLDIIGILPDNNGTIVIGNGTGISDFAAGYKLNVQGKIVCTELMVKAVAAWPDYVFNPGYSKLSIPELSSYIQQNRHLPGIPAAAEIEKSGIEMGEMQRKMMEKIEELTLYIIELEKRLQKQESK